MPPRLLTWFTTARVIESTGPPKTAASPDSGAATPITVVPLDAPPPSPQPVSTAPVAMTTHATDTLPAVVLSTFIAQNLL
jgi:hypothetical protein